MNKLYKYLPFDIDCYFNNGQYKTEKKKYKLSKILSWYPVNKLGWNWERISEWLFQTNVKPILRPFSHLTKELPLTKAAAEMIDMAEGEIILMEGELTDSDLINIKNNMIYFCSEEQLDFLRAMHFAVDFKECEFVELKD